MDSNEYAALALRTMSEETTLTVAVLGLCGESGEVADVLKKALAHGHDLDADKIKKELGDILWYVAACAHFLDTSMDEIMRANVRKLEERYPKGFDSKISRERYVTWQERATQGIAPLMNIAVLKVEKTDEEVGSPALD